MTIRITKNDINVMKKDEIVKILTLYYLKSISHIDRLQRNIIYKLKKINELQSIFDNDVISQLRMPEELKKEINGYLFFYREQYKRKIKTHSKFNNMIDILLNNIIFRNK